VRRRILTVVYDLEIGGTQRAAQNFSKAYHDAGHDVRVLTLYGGGPRQAQLESAGIQVTLGIGRPVEAATDLLKWKPDFVHVHRSGEADSVIASILRVFREIGSRVIETNVFSFFDRSADRRLTDLHLHLSNWCLWRWHLIGGTTNQNKSAGTVMPYLVNDEPFYRIPDLERQKFREDLGLKPNDILFGRVGQPSMAKWTKSLIPAFVSIAERNPNVHFMMIGAPNEVLETVQKLEKGVQKRIHLRSPTSSDLDLRRSYSSLDAFVHASYIGESFGMVLVESMLCEVPVVTLSTPRADNSQLEVVKHEEGGLVVLSDRFLNDAMLSATTNISRLQKLGKNGPALIKSRYTAKILIPQLEKIFFHIERSQNSIEIARAISKDGFAHEPRASEMRSLAARGIGTPDFLDSIFLQFPKAYLRTLDKFVSLRYRK
jgi:glycosyltransferase involved in cell wall biosynthesis